MQGFMEEQQAEENATPWESGDEPEAGDQGEDAGKQDEAGDSAD